MDISQRPPALGAFRRKGNGVLAGRVTPVRGRTEQACHQALRRAAARLAKVTRGAGEKPFSICYEDT